MSKFSGKCDFYDEIEIFGLDRILAAKVYVGNSDIPLELHNRKDCVPYYPYVITSSVHTQENGSKIWLTEKSWVDIEEERYGTMPYQERYKELLREEMKKYENAD